MIIPDRIPAWIKRIKADEFWAPCDFKIYYSMEHRDKYLKLGEEEPRWGVGKHGRERMILISSHSVPFCSWSGWFAES